MRTRRETVRTRRRRRLERRRLEMGWDRTGVGG